MPESPEMSGFFLSADVGGSHVSVGLCERGNYSLLPGSLSLVDVNSKGSAADIFNAWESAFKETLAKCPDQKIVGVAIAMPGPFDYENGISKIRDLGKYEAIYGLDIWKRLTEALGLKVQLKFRNDAESLLAGEALAGAGRGHTRVMGLTLGTGFGSAFTSSGETRDLNLGSEPFLDSIADEYFSTRWFVSSYDRLGGSSLRDGVRELAALALPGSAGKILFAQFAANLASFLEPYLEQHRPDLLLLCGNIAKASRHFLPELQLALPGLEIKLAALGEEAPLIGAAALFG